MSMHPVIVVSKEPISSCPPVMSVCLLMKKMGARLIVLTSTCDSDTRELLEKNGVSVRELDPKSTLNRSLLSKARSWYRFRAKAWDILSQFDKRNVKLWLGGAGTALVLGKRVFNYNYILQLHELYDRTWYRFPLPTYARGAKSVVVPELCRAGILRCWFRLSKTPFVLPNKPAVHPREKKMAISKRVESEFSLLDPLSRLILYQGIIHPEREIAPVAMAIDQLGKPWSFAAMGRARSESDSHKFFHNCGQVQRIPYVPPPYHLEITSHAYIGVVTYSYDSLNSVFCAPNKLWEFTGFGIPVITNNCPPLYYATMHHQIGVSIDMSMSNVEQVADAIQTISNNYQVYSRNALLFFDSIDLNTILANILTATWPELGLGHSD